MCKSIFEELEKKNVGVLVMGDLTGICAEANHGRNGNQKLHNFWAYNMVQKRLAELGEEHGIVVRKVSERDTSKTCCLCGMQHNGRVERGLMVCPQFHTSVNADVNGAVNIWNVAVDRFPQPLAQTERKSSSSGLLAEPLLLRWSYQKWQ